MIGATTRFVDGVQFIEGIRILEPDDTIGGIGVHLISWSIIDQAPEFMRAVKALGLRKVGEDICRAVDQYAPYPIPFLGIKLVQFALKVYWLSIWLLYDNARVFKQIPEGQCFSWSYFTPYVWYKGLVGKIRSN